MFENSLKRLVDLIEKLQGEDFKEKNVGKVFDLLASMKKMSYTLWPDQFENFNRLHLSVVFQMLENSHFNSKMNSL